MTTDQPPYEDFIRTYDDVLPEEALDLLQRLIDNVLIWDDSWTNRSDQSKKDNQYWLELEPSNILLASKINESLLSNAFGPYVNEFICLKDPTGWVSGSTLLQKTEPCQGYHTFHFENGGYNNVARHVTWMIYLNDVEEGGETEFLYQCRRIKPKRGLGAIWPGQFTHLHRGNPPMSTKYTLTGWFVASQGQICFG
jgi:hypothetical protein